MTVQKKILSPYAIPWYERPIPSNLSEWESLCRYVVDLERPDRDVLGGGGAEVIWDSFDTFSIGSMRSIAWNLRVYGHDPDEWTQKDRRSALTRFGLSDRSSETISDIVAILWKREPFDPDNRPIRIIREQLQAAGHPAIPKPKKPAKKKKTKGTKKP